MEQPGMAGECHRRQPRELHAQRSHRGELDAKSWWRYHAWQLGLAYPYPQLCERAELERQRDRQSPRGGHGRLDALPRLYRQCAPRRQRLPDHAFLPEWNTDLPARRRLRWTERKLG